MSKIAIASTDGVSINEHFGKTKLFFIYEIDDKKGTYQLLERRENILDKSDSHYLAAAQLLADVEVVLVSSIGPQARNELQRKGVIAFVLSGSIDKALTTYGKRRNIVKNITRGLVNNYHPGNGCACGCPKECP